MEGIMKEMKNETMIERREFIFISSATFGISLLSALLVPFVDISIASTEKYSITIDKEKCNGCEECIEVCPVDVFEMKGNKAVPANVQECLGCENCIEVCKNKAISLKKEE